MKQLLLSADERRIQRAWKALADDCRHPADTIAARLELSPADVVAVIYPPEEFAVWHDVR